MLLEHQVDSFILLEVSFIHANQHDRLANVFAANSCLELELNPTTTRSSRQGATIEQWNELRCLNLRGS